MARQASDINPDDVYLPSNLGPGDPWARQVVNDLIALKKESLMSRQFRDGSNRGDAASRASISDQIARSIVTTSATNFALTFSVPTTAADMVSTAFVVPTGFSRVDIITQGYFLIQNDTSPRGYPVGKIAVNGVPGYSFLGYEVGLSASNAVAYSSLGDTRTLSVTAGASITVSLTMSTSGAGPLASHVSNRAHINLVALFHN